MNVNQISMLQIVYFLAVAQHLNFTEAAKSLYISQPSISKQIALLEKELEVQLFFRTKRSVRLTPAGTVLLKELTGISERIAGALSKCRQPDLAEGGTISVGCLEALNTGLFLRKTINEFKMAHPGVSVILERHSFKALRDKLINGSLDLIFTMSFEIDDSLDIVYDTVQHVNTSIVMSSSHPLAVRESVKLADLRDENFVFISRDESPKGLDSAIALCRKHGFTPRIIKQLPNVESLLHCVESGLGVSLFDSTIRLYNTENFKLYPLEGDSIDFVMAWKKENMNPAVSLFTNLVLSRMSLE
mgnify:CR=1 FL=1